MTFTEELKQSDGNDFTKYQISVHQMMTYPNLQAVAYLMFGLMGAVGKLADVERRVVRGDYESKGSQKYEKVVEEIINSCAGMTMYVAELVSVAGDKLGDILDADTFEDFEEDVGVGREESKMTPGTLTLLIGMLTGDLVGDIGTPFTQQDKEKINEIAHELMTYICQITLLLERPLSSVFELKRIKLDTGES